MGGDPDILVVLTTARTEFEAEALAEALRSRGIPAEVFGGTAASGGGLQWYTAGSDPIKVMVRRGDVALAERVRVAIKADSVDLDWDEVDVGVGEAGSDGESTADVHPERAEGNTEFREPVGPRSTMKKTSLVTWIGWRMLAVCVSISAGSFVGLSAWTLGAGPTIVTLMTVLGAVGTLVFFWVVTRK
ncbi:MAG: hypothetical protein IPK69_05245 [Phycisphaerales bacterium]|nr:MAG: hypothetical protein IPK69_05245 [Phycisphaerales bacterium]